MNRSSKIKEFYKKKPSEKREFLKNFAGLDHSEIAVLDKSLETAKFAENMSENVVGVFSLPYSIASNFLINGQDYMIPMVTEESSVVAAASNAAKLCRQLGGFTASADEPIMIGNIYLTNVTNITDACHKIESNKQKLLDIANKRDQVLVSAGGGALDIKLSTFSDANLKNVISVQLTVNVKDAMGANAVNSMAEAIAYEIEKLVGIKALASILSNLATLRIAKASATWTANELDEGSIDKIISMNKLAKADVFRAVTHNKGIMNGIDAVAIATGNDFRAIEAGAHGFSYFGGTYKPLTNYAKDRMGNLVGTIELPVAVGIVGGSTKINPLAQISLKILSVKTAKDLAAIIASVGLAQNFAALYALVSKGIQFGHMKLHSRNIAFNAGAREDLTDFVAEKMVENHTISEISAKEILNSIKDGARWK